MKTFQKQVGFYYCYLLKKHQKLFPRAVLAQQSPKGRGSTRESSNQQRCSLHLPLLWGRKQCLVQDLPHQCMPQPQDLPPPLSLPANPVFPPQQVLRLGKGERKKQAALCHSASFNFPASPLTFLFPFSLSKHKAFISLNFLLDSLITTRRTPAPPAMPRPLRSSGGWEGSRGWDLEEGWGGRSRTQG